MVKNKMVNRLVSLLCALFLFVSSVLVSYQTAYASVSITEAGSYFLRMLCSAAGIYFEHSEVGVVVDVLSQIASQSDTINSKEFQERMDYVLSLSPADRIDATFSNAFLSDLINGFRESTVNEDGHGGGGVSFPVPSDIFVGTGDFSVDLGKFTTNITDALSPVVMYCFNDSNGLTFNVFFVSEHRFRMSGNLAYYQCGNYYADGYVLGSEYLDSIKSLGAIFLSDIGTSLQFRAWLGSADYAFPDLKVTNIPFERVWIDAFDDAALHAPAITAPITIPADVSAMEENAKAVAAADNADALYKALAAAGIAIGVDVDVPDETDKPTDAEIPDEGSSAIGKQLSAIYEGILGLADKVGSIPAQFENFFTIDTDAIGDAFMGLKDAFSSRFEVLKAFGTIFDNLSYTLKDTPPIIKFRVPPDLVRYFGSEEVVAMDLTAYADYCSLIRTAVQCLLWFGFVLALLDEFDIKFNVA